MTKRPENIIGYYADNDYDYKLIVLGNPKGQSRHRQMNKDKFGNLLKYPIRYDPSVNDKAEFLMSIQNKAPKMPISKDKFLRVDIFWFFSRPLNHYGTGKNSGILKANAPTHCNKKYDRDNLDKFVLDALNGKFWLDDKIVCSGNITKFYSDIPRTEIYIKILEN